MSPCLCPPSPHRLCLPSLERALVSSPLFLSSFFWVCHRIGQFSLSLSLSLSSRLVSGFFFRPRRLPRSPPSQQSKLSFSFYFIFHFILHRFDWLFTLPAVSRDTSSPHRGRARARPHPFFSFYLGRNEGHAQLGSVVFAGCSIRRGRAFGCLYYQCERCSSEPEPDRAAAQWRGRVAAATREGDIHGHRHGRH